MRRAALIAGALLCFALAAGVLALARDVAGWRDAFQTGDVRYRVAPQAAGLWRPDGTMPADPARGLLGIEDDLAFRRALQALRHAGVEDMQVSDPEVALRRNDARTQLAAVAGGDPDRARRSRALGLVGVLSLASALSNVQQATPLLRDALVRFRGAIALDPDNAEAKVNLELGLRRDEEISQGGGGERPTPGGEGAAGAGTQETGTGY